MTALKHREKAVIVDVLKDKYSLPLLLQRLRLSKSSYYYQRKQMKSLNKYTALSTCIIDYSQKPQRDIPENTFIITTSGFYAFATLEMMGDAMKKASPDSTNVEKLWKTWCMSCFV